VRSDLQRVLELQGEYQARLSLAMSERGVLVRDAIPSWLDSNTATLSANLGIDDFFAEGRDGTGLKTRVPWARFGSRSLSPRATVGFYVVYLFDAAGGNVYLSLNQGTTDFRGGDFVRKPAEQILARVDWAKSVLGSWRGGFDDSPTTMELNDPGLGAGYELGNIASVGYAVGAIPDDSILLADAERFAVGLGTLYRAHHRQPIPDEQPELEEAEESARKASGITSKGGRAGFRTNSTEIKAIENHAVEVARAYYEDQGFSVKVLGKPFDLEVTKEGANTLTVEVKGTTSDGSGVPLTAGEVQHHANAFPDNALIVVRNITLHRDGDSPRASGGHLYELRPWSIDSGALRVISYGYEVPSKMYDDSGVSAENSPHHE
jgi:hypothetical protein